MRVMTRPTPITYRNGTTSEKVTPMTWGASVNGSNISMAKAVV